MNLFIRKIFIVAKYILNSFIYFIIKYINFWEWRKINSHNATYPVKKIPLHDVRVGKGTYGNLDVRSFNKNIDEKLYIGNYVSIADDVIFLLGGNHQINTFTTYPLKSHIIKKDYQFDATTKGPIIIEDEVWIGYGVLILSGVKISKGAIIAAGSVVTKDIPPFAIAGGNPARVFRYRFTQDIIEALNSICISDFDEKFIIENIEEFYYPLDIDQIDKLKKMKESNK